MQAQALLGHWTDRYPLTYTSTGRSMKILSFSILTNSQSSLHLIHDRTRSSYFGSCTLFTHALYHGRHTFSSPLVALPGDTGPSMDGEGETMRRWSSFIGNTGCCLAMETAAGTGPTAAGEGELAGYPSNWRMQWLRWDVRWVLVGWSNPFRKPVTSTAQWRNPARNRSAYEASGLVVNWFWWRRVCKWRTVSSRMSAFSSLATFSPSCVAKGWKERRKRFSWVSQVKGLFSGMSVKTKDKLSNGFNWNLY